MGRPGAVAAAAAEGPPHHRGGVAGGVGVLFMHHSTDTHQQIDLRAWCGCRIRHTQEGGGRGGKGGGKGFRKVAWPS